MGNILENAFFVTTPPNIKKKMRLKSEKREFLLFFPIFTKGIKAKLNYLESESEIFS